MDVEQLTREQLENIVIEQSKSLIRMQEALMYSQKEYEELDDAYDELSTVILNVRSVLSCI